LRRTEREFLRPEDLLPVALAAQFLGVSASTVHNAINAGKLRCRLFGTVRRVRQEDLEAYALARGRPSTGR
jgi:excisionase family DNA binding protein